MAAADTAKTLPAAANCAVFLNRFDHVVTTAGLVPAFRTEQRADRVLIESHQSDHNPAGQPAEKLQRTVDHVDAPGGCGLR